MARDLLEGKMKAGQPRDLLAGKRAPIDLLAGKNITPVKEKPRADLKSLAFGGVPGFSMMPGSEDYLPMAGQALGSSYGYAGSVSGATAGQAARQGVKALRGEKINISSIPKESLVTGITEGVFRGAGKLLRPTANRLMLSIMKPAREAIKKNPQMGVEAVEQGIFGTKSGMVSKAEKLIKNYENEISSKIKGRPERINAKKIIDELEGLKSKAIQGLKPEDAKAIEEIKQYFIEKIPQKTVRESRGFVTTVGKKTTPQTTTTKIIPKGVTPEFDKPTGEYINKIQTSKQFIENPEDIVALEIAGKGASPRKIISASPKTEYKISALKSPEYSTSTKVFDPLGMNLESGQAMKKAIYSETPGSAFSRQINELPGKTEARRTIASSLRRQIGKAAPDVMPILRKESVAIGAKEALENRLANEAKQMIIGKLGGMGAGGAAFMGRPDLATGILLGDLAVSGLRSAPVMSGSAALLANLAKRKALGQTARLSASELARRAQS